MKTVEKTTITAIVGNNCWILRLVDGPFVSLEKMQNQWSEVKHTSPFRMNEFGDICVQYLIEAKDANKYNFQHQQQFQVTH